ALVRDTGGEVRTGALVRSMRDVPPHRALILDLTPRQLLVIDVLRFPSSYEGRLRRYRYGRGVCKVDYALDGPVHWSDPACASTPAASVSLTAAPVRPCACRRQPRRSPACSCPPRRRPPAGASTAPAAIAPLAPPFGSCADRFEPFGPGGQGRRSFGPELSVA